MVWNTFVHVRNVIKVRFVRGVCNLMFIGLCIIVIVEE